MRVIYLILSISTRVQEPRFSWEKFRCGLTPVFHISLNPSKSVTIGLGDYYQNVNRSVFFYLLLLTIFSSKDFVVLYVTTLASTFPSLNLSRPPLKTLMYRRKVVNVSQSSPHLYVYHLEVLKKLTGYRLRGRRRTLRGVTHRTTLHPGRRLVLRLLQCVSGRTGDHRRHVPDPSRLTYEDRS